MLTIALTGMASLFWTVMMVFTVVWARRISHIPISRRRQPPLDVRRLGYIAIGFAVVGALLDMAATLIR